MERSRGRWLSAAIALAITVGVILAGTAAVGGGRLLYENLLQLPTRPGEPLEWGGHWRYHLLSRSALLFLGLGIAGAMIRISGGTKGDPRGVRIFGTALAVFVALTLVFLPNTDPFRDPVFLGHQARELFTHALVTVPMAWGVCLALAEPASDESHARSIGLTLPLLAGVAAVVLGLYLAVAVITTSAVSQGQSESLVVLIFPHFFEHTFSYLAVTATAALVFERSAE